MLSRNGYQHLGRRYMSLELDLDKKLCRVEPVAVDYYTEAVWEGRLDMTAEEERQERHGATLRFGAVHVNKQPKLYKKIRERSLENIGYGPITLPPFEYDTTGFCLSPPPAWRAALDARDKRLVPAALFGLRYVLRHAAPPLCMADAGDIETDLAEDEESSSVISHQSSVVKEPTTTTDHRSPDTEPPSFRSALYLYDAIAGGVGYAEKVFEKFGDTLELCRAMLAECDCENGCPACVPPLPPGVADAELELFLVESDAARSCTRSLLHALIDGQVCVPEVRTIRRAGARPVTAPTPDAEAARIAAQLARAATTLRKNRAREH